MGKTIGVVLALKDKCSPQLKKIADSMGMTEKEAKKLQKQAKDLSKELGGGIKKAATICTAAVGAVAVATQQLVSKTMEAGDRVDKMSQKIGMSRKSFQEWDYIMSQNGSSVDVLQVGYKKLATTMEGAVKGSKDSVATFKQLGVSVRDSNGQLRKQEDVFNDSIRALQKIQNPTQKAILANKLFGKSAIDLKPLLNQSAESVDELRKKANDLGMVMSDEAVDASVKLTDTMDTIKRTMGGLGVSIGAEFLPVIQQMSDKFIEAMPKIKQVVTPVINGIINVIKFLADNMDLVIGVATTLISTFLAFQTINGVIKTITTLQKVIQLVTAAQGVWNAVMLANPIGAIAVGIGLVIGAIVLLIKNWDKLKKAFTETMEKHLMLKDIANLIKFVFNLTPIGLFINGIKLVIQNWDLIKQAVIDFYNKFKPIFDFIGKIIKVAFNLTPIMLFINALKLLDANWEKIHNTIKKAVDTVKQFIGLKPGKKTVEVETKTTTVKEDKPKKHALGTSFSTGGPALVGENGPELLNLKKGDSVTPAPQTQKALQGRDINVKIEVLGNIIGNAEFLQQLKNMLALELRSALAVV